MKRHIQFFKKNLFHILTILFWVIIVISYFYFKKVNHLSNDKIIKYIYFFLKKEFLYGGLIYISIYALRTIIFFPSSLLIILSPSLFGLPLAIVYTILGENLSAVLGYFLGKFFGKNILSDGILDKFHFLKKKFREDSFLTILSARLLFIPFDPLSYISGFFKAEFGGYFWGTVLGTLPSILIFIFAGAGIKNIEKFNLSHIKLNHNYMIASGVMILLSLGMVFFLKKRKKCK